MVQTKSRHHKNENTFRFQTLNERLANISVDVTKRINRYNQKPEETETYFYQALEKWVDLNYTAVFHDFTINVKSKCQTLAMLIYHKDDLIVILKEFILKADELSLQPILDLTAQLARDLQNDFYQYFPEIFKCIVKLLDTQNTEILEWSFQTLSYLFKFLWRYMLKNLDSVYELYSPLFDESRKYYIRNFAAESFAFLMRKIQNKNELFNFLLTQRLVEHPEELNGIGRLVFEMFKGIKHQFNVSMDASFNIVLEKLNFFESDEHKNDLIFNCIGVTVQSMAEFTKKEHTGIVWKCFYATIDKFLDNKKKITYLIRLIEIFLQVKQCYLIDNLDLFLDNMIKLSQINVDDSENSLELTRFFFDLGKLILTSDNVKFSIEKTNILPVRLYQEKYSFELVSNLTRNLFTYTLFETVILPNVISYFESQMKANYQSDKSLEKLFLALIAEYLLVHKNILNNSNQSKSKEFDSTDKFDAFIKVKGLIHINRLFQSNNESLLIKKMGEFFMSEIGFYEKNKPVETLIKALISAPFILKHLDLITPLINLINKLTEAIKSDLTIDINDKEMENFELKTYVFYLSIWSLSLHSKINFQNEIVKLITKLNEIKETQKSILNTNYDFISLDLASNHLLNSLWTSDPSKEVLKPVLNHLRNELSSPYPQNRINSLNLLSICYEKNDLPVNEESENLFDICLKIELTPASLDEYRHKIYFLQKLDTIVCTKLLNENLNQEVPLKYLFGLLYENFKLLWEPTIQLIQSYASSMKQNDFWNILCEFLLELTHKIECKRDQSKYRRVFQTESDQFNLMKSLEKSRYENMNNIDYLNNRLLLCKSMQGFASICEAKTKILVPLFFRFINNEYYKEENRLLSTSYEDLTKKYIKDRTNEKTTKEKYFSKSLLNKHLCAFLDIFSKFTSPKSWYQEENLRNLYHNLLCHYDSTVQKSALNCLYTYQHEFVKPYQEHLEKLLEGKHFRHELVVFSLDENSGVIHNDHRKRLLPILMRILYGKFNSNETTHTSSRDTKSNKRSIIIQFLSSCDEYELNYFFNLIFDSLNVALMDSNDKNLDRFDFNDNKLDENERNQFLKNLINRLNKPEIYSITKCVSFKKILGILQSLDIILKKLARQMENFSHRILLMLCFIQKYTFKINEIIFSMNQNEKLVDDYHLNLIKVIKQQVSIRFKQFFDTFDHLNFTQYEYYLIFDSFIWPQSTKLANESLKSVNNLMKIFSLWSERSKYYPLFVIKKQSFDKIEQSILESQLNGNSCLLDVIFSLIDSDKCSQNVIDYVFEIIHNLVSFADFKEENDNPELALTLKLPFNTNQISERVNDELNYGTLILQPYVTSIVNHIEKIVSINMSKKSLPPKPLKILARISSFASNSQSQCEKIILLLIPYLVKNRNQSEENELNILSSVNYLIKQVKFVNDFVAPLSRLFLVIKNRQSRNELCNIYKSIKERDNKFETLSGLILDLNSWDAKRLEEPDYMLRLEAFKQLNAIVQSWSIFDINIASILIYNSFFFINEIEDLAIKESSTNSIKILLQKSSTIELSKLERNLFESNFISSLKQGLRSKTENCRHEYISILIELIKKFQIIIPYLKDFNILFDFEDQEKDFFENIKHIQMHRRSRALKRLQINCHQISTENLLGFMMPIVRSFVDNEMYHKYDYLVEESCNTIGSICSTLEWSKYIKIVDYYLKILPKNVMNQKLVVKILVQVLDAFHYDLSLSTEKDYYVDQEEDMMTEQVNRSKKLVGSAMANKIHSTVTKSIIPVLFKCLTKRLRSENEHKINKRDDEDEQILRVPMALAILKLLNNLPRRTLETHLPGLLFKVCDMLKSRAMSVRNTTRECLIKMVETLPEKKYYFNVFKELGNSLLKGYQVHVLCFTNLMVLKNVQSKLQVGDLDSSLKILLNSVSLELFSDSSEEKEVKQIVAKLMEAKTISSYQTLQIIAKYISQNELLTLLKLFKDQLDFCTSRKILNKIEEALKYILNGLLENQSLTTDALMCLVYGLINDTFEAFKDSSAYKTKLKRKKAAENEAKPENFDDNIKETKMPESCLLIPSEPKRGGEKPKTQAKTNQHVIIEFSLKLMHSLMKQNRLIDPEQETKNVQVLDPYIPIFIEYLDGKYLKVTIVTLRCLSSLLKYPLPSIEKNCREIAAKLFNLLRIYSSSSTIGERGDNLELLMVCYKVISNLIRDVQQFNLNDEQLQILLHYAEKNLYDNQKQASAFNLLKSILSRKLMCDELTDVLAKVMKLSIQADSANVRLQSRQTMLQYILDYSLPEKKLSKLLEFYVMQLNYEYENGRESAIEMLATLFNTFPTSKLNEHSALFYLPLAVQLHNDESAKCKKLASLAIKSLLEKISIEKRDSLFNITVSMFKNDDKPLHKRIGALLIKIYVECEKEQFEKRLNIVFDLLIKELDTQNFNQVNFFKYFANKCPHLVSLLKNLTVDFNSNSIVTEKFFDQYLYNLLSLFMKILNELKIFNEKCYLENINVIYDQVKTYLCYEHLWVRLISCQLFGIMFVNHSIDFLVQDKQSYFNHKCVNNDIGNYLKIRDLIDEFCVQLKAPILENDLAEQIVKNLAFMAKILNRFELKNDDQSELLKHDINIEWLIRKVSKEAKYELVNKPKETIKRTYIFKLFAAISIELGKEKIKNYIHLLIPLLQREIEIDQNDENLKRLAKEVIDFIKQTIGVEEFSLIYSKANKKRTENKEERKRKIAQLAVVEPQLAATKKIRKQQRKKEAKKRKISNEKEKINGFKKRKINLTSDEF